MPPKNKNNSYLTCPRLKGQPKKHIKVCHKCRFRKRCRPYRDHCQAQLPFSFGSERKTQARKSSQKDPEPDTPGQPFRDDQVKKLLLEIEKDLRAIQRLYR